VVAARRRAELIEGNLRLLYEPRSLCTASERLSEELLEGLVLRGPRRQLLCSGDRWGLLGRSQDLRVEAEPLQGGAVMLQARLPGRSVAVPLLTVTAADAQLHGLSTTQLAADWREVLERRHATLQAQVDALDQALYSMGEGNVVDHDRISYLKQRRDATLKWRAIRSQLGSAYRVHEGGLEVTDRLLKEFRHLDVGL
jgi:hypothetical protein